MMRRTIFCQLKACEHGNELMSCMRDGNFLSSQVIITSQEGFSCMNWLRHSGSTLKMEAAGSSETLSTKPTSTWCQYQKNSISVNVTVKVTH
jgi:hypothetical protein